MKISLKFWLAILAAIALAFAGLAGFLFMQGQSTAGWVVGAIGNVLFQGWVIFGVWVWREVPWVRRYGWILIISAAAGLLAGLAEAMGATNFAQSIGGILAMAVVFWLGTELLRLLFSFGHPIIGVARTTLEEAMRMKAPLSIIVLLIIFLPVLPLLLSSGDLLKYRITQFLTYGMMFTGLCLSLMTIFLSVGTVTSEIQNRQIFLTLTKPVSRAQYLGGKLLGIGMLNLLLVVVSGLGIYLFATVMASRVSTEARNNEDAFAVRNEVMVARQTVKPMPAVEGGLAGLLEQRLTKLQQDDPATYGQPGTSIDVLSSKAREKIELRVIQTWYTIGPSNRTTYRFPGLKNLPADARTVQLRFKPKLAKAPSDGLTRFRVRINDRDFLSRTATGNDPFEHKVPDNKFHVMTIPLYAQNGTPVVNDDGTLLIEIFNHAPGQASLTFNPKDGLELLYKVDSFESNLTRSMFLMWLRLVMLSMLGIAASTFLGFPVACLLTLLLYVAASGHGYITESVSYYSAFPRGELSAWEKLLGVPQTIGDKWSAGEYVDGFKVIVRLFATAFLSITPSFSEYNPTPLVSNGRMVSWSMVGQALLWVGGVYTGVLAVIAYVLFRAREIARVIV